MKKVVEIEGATPIVSTPVYTILGFGSEFYMVDYQEYSIYKLELKLKIKIEDIEERTLQAILNLRDSHIACTPDNEELYCFKIEK